MRTLVCSALLCGLPITGIAAQLSVSPQYISAEYASPKIIRVDHKATDDVPTTQMLTALPADAAQLSVSPQYISAEYASPKIIRVHHEATDDVPTTQMLTALPADDWPMTNWYKQTVYDFGGNKIGEIADLLVDHDGKNTAVLIGVGGVLGIGEKYVAVPFDAVHFKKKDDGWYPVINTTKEALKSAPGYRYDRKAQMWGRENAPASVGGPGIPPANQR